ncbi:MAG: hypothetical protein QM844_05200, partial [Planctomycetota bacterium]|nr:hypothetical protein [Planctomycetota bacterium]
SPGPSPNPSPPPGQHEEGVRVHVEGVVTEAVQAQNVVINGQQVTRVTFEDRLPLEGLDKLENALRLVLTGQADTLQTELPEMHFNQLSSNNPVRHLGEPGGRVPSRRAGVAQGAAGGLAGGRPSPIDCR